MQAPRVAVFGIFGRTNLGNEATLAAFLASLRQRLPGARVVCIGPHGCEVTAGHGLELIEMEPLRVRAALWRHFWRFRHNPLVRAAAFVIQLATEPRRRRLTTERMRNFDVLVVPGTGILDDFGQGPLDLPHHLLRWCLAARRASVPVYFLSVGAEAVPGRLTRRILRRAAELSAYLSYRDAESRRNAESLGVSAPAQICPDLAFSLPRTQLPAFDPVAWPPRRVGLGVMGYYGWNREEAVGERIYLDYLAKLSRFVSWLLERNLSIRLLTGDTGPDARPIRELAETFGTRVTAEPIADFHDLLDQIAQTDVVVGTRFHNVLLALLLERPTVSIGYSSKNDALLAEFGLGEYCQDIETFQVDRLVAQFERLTRCEQPPVASIRRCNDEFRARLDEQYDRVLAGLGNGQQASEHRLA
jgi:polysaccharide pyruvyl transferase WcaK-like protein